MAAGSACLPPQDEDTREPCRGRPSWVQVGSVMVVDRLTFFLSPSPLTTGLTMPLGSSAIFI